MDKDNKNDDNLGSPSLRMKRNRTNSVIGSSMKNNLAQNMDQSQNKNNFLGSLSAAPGGDATSDDR